MKKKFYALIPYLLVSIFTLSSCGGSSSYELHTEEQLGYIKDSDYNSINKYASSLSPKGTPLGIELDTKNGQTLLIGEKNTLEMDTPWLFDVNDLATYSLYNCKAGQDYYYQVCADDKTIREGTFTVAETYPRLLNVSGVKNVRDLGSKNIKQGLIYRGGEFDFISGTKMKNNITADGIETLNNQIRITTDIDLRYIDETYDAISPLGEMVNYVHIPMYYKGKENILTYGDNPEQIKKVFTVLADTSNYPVYFHCAKGKDRTGLISYLIKGLMGDSLTDIYKDYLFTNFTFANAVEMDTILNTYVKDIESTSGSSLAEKIANYLVNNIGIETSIISSVKGILKANEKN